MSGTPTSSTAVVGVADFVTDMATLLWPPPASARLTAGRHAHKGSAPGWVCVPSASRPVLLVPDGAAKAAAEVVRSYAEAGSARSRLRTAALAFGFRTGLANLLFPGRLVRTAPAPAATIETELSDLFGQDCLLGLHTGPARANRKPVLTVVDRNGRLLGFVKVGFDDLTRRLVGVEAAALTELAGLAIEPVRVAPVLGHLHWRDLELLVQAPLPVRLPRETPPRARRDEAVMAIASAAGTTAAGLTTTPAWQRTVADLSAAGGSDAGHLREIADVVGRRPAIEVTVGAWHGDWQPGNYAFVSGSVLAWDWERFAHGVPVGWDALHDRLQGDVMSGQVTPHEAATRLLSDADSALGAFGVAPVDAPWVAVGYLLHLGARYLKDDQLRHGSRLGRLDTWLLPALSAVVSPGVPPQPARA